MLIHAQNVIIQVCVFNARLQEFIILGIAIVDRNIMMMVTVYNVKIVIILVHNAPMILNVRIVH